MEKGIEEFSMAQLGEMSDREVNERITQLHDLIEALSTEIDKCEERLAKTRKKCDKCGSTNIEPKAKGGYFCRRCGYRVGPVAIPSEAGRL